MNGYQSDFDLLVVVSHEKLTDVAEFWYIVAHGGSPCGT
jgi:hypothetical protein